MEDRAAIEQSALCWHQAVCEGTVDWDAFTLWLEAAPAHAAAYDSVALADSLLDQHRDALSQTHQAQRQRHRWWPVGAGVAASLLALAWWHGGASTTPSAPDITQTSTAARALALADGTHITLAPRSRLEQRGNSFSVAGDAVFDVPHRPGRTMVITGGGLAISDIGTRFELNVEAQGVRLTVAEGRVSVALPGVAAPLIVNADHALLWRASTAQATLSERPHARIGTWARGELSYTDAPLDLVVADIARYGDRPLALSPALGDTHFTGTLLLGHGHSPAQDLARLLGLAWHVPAAGGAGRLEPANQR